MELQPVEKSQMALAWGAQQATGIILATAEEVVDFMEENKNDLELMAKIRYLAMEYSGEQLDEWDSAIDYQAAELNQSGVASYHPEHFQSVSEFMQSALQGSQLGTSAYYRAKNIVQYVLPYCAQHGISIPETVLDKGNKSKFGLIGEHAKGIIEDIKAGVITQSDGEAKLTEMLADTVNPEVTFEKFREKNRTNPRPKLPAVAYSYAFKFDQTVLVIDCKNTQQYGLIVKLLDGNIDLHMGDGNETVLMQLEQLMPQEE